MAEKNKYGQYFTISDIAKFMVSLIHHNKDSKILEPSCGKGVFLDELIAAGFNNLSAFEIDETLGTKYDFVKFQSFLSVSTSEKYDVIIGNPPYIRWKNLENELKDELENNYLWKKYFNNLCDYLFIFILKSIEHLNENGELIFICTEYWLNTKHSESLRNYICNHGYFEEIYHFKEASLFEKVTASFIIFRFIKSNTSKKNIDFYLYKNENKRPQYIELINKECFQFEIIPSFKENSRWLLANRTVQDQLKKFELTCSKKIGTLFDTDLYRLGEFCDIGNGMVSGLDKAFKVNDIHELNEIERSSVIPVVKAKDLQQFKYLDITYYFFLNGLGISEIELQTYYPHFFSKLQPYVNNLNNRYNYGRNIPYWEFVFPRNKLLFERKESRIFVPCKERISNKSFFRFCFIPQGIYPTQDISAIFLKRTCKESIEYVLAYLNSQRVYNWLIINGIIKGAIVEFSEMPLASIPYRQINWEDEFEIEIHEKITNEVKSLMKDGQQERINELETLFNKLF